MKVEVVLLWAGLIGLTLAGCPNTPPPNVPPNDASDSAPPAPPSLDASQVSFEQGVCSALAPTCPAAKLPGCAASIAANKIPGGYASEWAACLYAGTNPNACHVPCQGSP